MKDECTHKMAFTPGFMIGSGSLQLDLFNAHIQILKLYS